MKYLDYIKRQEPHHRRRWALGMAGVITGVFFFAWLASFSSRLGSESVVEQNRADQAAAAAAVYQPDAAGLEVATTSVYSY